MSFWLPGRHKDGKRYLYSVSIPMMLLITAMGILLALFLPLLQWLRALLR
jgi:hypothetical protein